MPGIWTRSSGNLSNEHKFKTVLGLGALQNGVKPLSSFTPSPYDAEHEDDALTDTPDRSKSQPSSVKHRGRRLRGKIPQEHKSPERTMPPAADLKASPRAARLPRADADEGIWSVSVAEASPRAFTLYVKTPAHSLTLTRSANEIAEVHFKIQDQIPAGTVLPPCPLESDPPQKRKSSFLTTLSRLASPPRNVTPLFTPESEALPADALTANKSSSSTTELSQYFTILANDKTVRVTRSWKRFVRVRTDDLESTRVERAIKRVRSDLAAHAGNAQGLMAPSNRTSIISADRDGAKNGGVVDDDDRVTYARNGMLGAPALTPDDASADENARRLIDSGLVDFSVPPSIQDATPTTSKLIKSEEPKPEVEEEPKEEVIPETEVAPEEPAEHTEPEPKAEDEVEIKPEDILEEESVPEPISTTTSVTDHHPSRIPRSASADPDKASRLSRVWQESPVPPAQSETDAEATEATDAEDTDAYGASAMSDTGGPEEEQVKKVVAKKKKKERKTKKVVIDDFQMMRVLGKGCAGKVLLVKHKKTQSLYALKAITKRHVLAHQELQHTMTEQAVLKRMARSNTDPFVVKLYWSFHDKENLFLVMDFHPGGDLATQLARWGRLGRDRARFYAAEIVEGCEGLHAAGVIYRDLKPENILIGGDGHIVLTDFGLSKEFPRKRPLSMLPNPHENAGGDYYASSPATPTGENHNNGLPYWMNGSATAQRDFWLSTKGNDTTTTFCGTAEYLAPEVIQGLQYSYEVDWWSFGTMLYEMLTGITPFWANNHSDMYVRVLQDELTFPEDKAMDQDTKSLIRGLLQRNPALRLCEPRIKKHPYFSMIDWQHVYHKRYIPPYIPPIDAQNAADTQNFDEAFLEMEPILDSELENDDQTGSERDRSTTDVDIAGIADEESTHDSPSARVRDDDVFDGYSFKARNSVLIEDDDGNEGSDESEDDRTREGTIEEEELDAGQKTPDAHVQVVPPTPTPASEVVDAFRKMQEQEHAPTTQEQTTEEAGASEAVVLEEAEPTSPRTPRNKVNELPVEQAAPASPEKDLPKPPVVDAVAPTTAGAPVVPVKEEKEKKEKKEKKAVTISEKPRHLAPEPKMKKPARRERSGVAALDRDLSDVMDEDEVGVDREDDDWDFIEAPGEGREEWNGKQGSSLFARGVVDRYRLRVFRKPSNIASNKPPPVPHNVSSNSALIASESEFGEVTATNSPLPSEKKRSRGGGLSLRKPRTFLRPKSPSATYSAGSSRMSRPALSTQHSATISGSSSGALLTPMAGTPLSVNGATSLKSQPSMNSVGSPGSSDQSINGGDLNRVSLTQSAAELASSPGKTRGNKSSPDLRRQAKESNPNGDPAREKGLKKMRKYTDQTAEKVMSLFSSPRSAPAPES